MDRALNLNASAVTVAHNTVEIDGQDPSEVWSGFRVARRVFQFNIGVSKDDASITVDVAHCGDH